MIIFCLHYHNKIQTYMYSTVPESVTFLIIERMIVFELVLFLHYQQSLDKQLLFIKTPAILK